MDQVLSSTLLLKHHLVEFFNQAPHSEEEQWDRRKQ